MYICNCGMIAIWLFCGAAITLSSASASSSILTSMKDDGSYRIFKDPRNELEYVLKRNNADTRDEPDSKERRSNMGASFIRFGRGEDGPVLPDNNVIGSENNPQVSRQPRFKSPDIVIRFGRSGSQNFRPAQLVKRAKSDLNFIRFGRNVQTLPEEVDLSVICSELLSGDSGSSKHLSLYLPRLLRLCGVLQSIDDDHTSNLDFVVDDNSRRD